MKMLSHIVIAGLALLAPAFTALADAPAAELLLQERLSPVLLAVPPLPRFAVAAANWSKDALVPLVAPRAFLPVAALAAERKPERPATRRARVRSVPDKPPLATDVDRSAPGRAVLAAGARINAPAPDIDRLPGLTPTPRPRPERATYATDPTADQSRAQATTATPRLRERPAPPVKMAIPNPEEGAAATLVQTDVPDADPPARAYVHVDRVTLPAAAPAK